MPRFKVPLSLTGERSRWSGSGVLHGLVVKVVQVSDVAVLDTHEAGQALHVLVPVGRTAEELEAPALVQEQHAAARNSRGLAFSQQQAGQAQFEPRLHHLAAHRFQLQCQIVLRRRSAGELLHVDVDGG